jgi:hypothetical protein
MNFSNLRAQQSDLFVSVIMSIYYQYYCYYCVRAYTPPPLSALSKLFNYLIHIFVGPELATFEAEKA